jgi:hypothetical protein
MIRATIIYDKKYYIMGFTPVLRLFNNHFIGHCILRYSVTRFFAAGFFMNYLPPSP